MVDIPAVEAALEELAHRLVIPADLISVHRAPGAASQKQEYRSIRYGAFLLAYGPLERFFNRLVERHGGPSRGLPLTTDKVRQTFHERLGTQNLTGSWRARARVAPGPWAPDRRWRWTYIDGTQLRDYLRDACQMRHLLAHGADPKDTPNDSRTLYVLKNGSVSVTLMWVEGFLQVAQDLAAQTAMELAGDDVQLPSWHQPVRSGVSASLPPAPHQERLPII